MDRTLILVKPDAFARGLTGEIVARGSPSCVG
jgi:nucleoside diphosphate kinase